MNNRDVMITVRLRPEEADRLRGTARAHHTTISHIIRTALTEDIPLPECTRTHLRTATPRQLTEELRYRLTAGE